MRDSKKVTLNGGVGTAGDKKITGLTSGNKYTVTVDGAKKGVKADGTLGAEGEAAALTGTEITGLDNAKTYTVEEVKVAPTKVTLNGAVGTAGDKKITGLTSGNKYTVTVDGTKKGVKADGTLGTEGEAAALTGTEITGLDNAKTYTVEEVKVAPTKVTLNGAIGTAGDKKITGLTSGNKYTVTVDGTKKGVKADGTLGTEGEAAALTGTEITGLDNAKAYTVEEVKVAPTKVTLNGAVGTAGDKKITGLTSGNKYTVTVDGTKKGVKADGTLGTEGEAAALTGTEITGLDNAKTYTVEQK